VVHRPRHSHLACHRRDPQEPVVIVDLAGLVFALMICLAVWAVIGRSQ
jgi:hypothetical protein